MAVASREGKERLVLLSSDDGGDTFGEPAVGTPPAPAGAWHGENAPQLLFVGQGSLYAAWEAATGDHVDVLFARSEGFGGPLEKPARVTDSDPLAVIYSGYPSVVRAPDGSIYAAWLDWRDSSNAETAAVYLARSTDDGRTFGRNTRVASGVCPCCRPAVAALPSGEVVVVWRNVYAGNVRDMAAAASSDFGRSFRGPFRVAVDDWKIDGCPDSGAAVARVGSRLFVAWMTEGSPSHAGIRLTWSDDGGQTFAAPIVASGSVPDANYPVMAATPEGRVLLAFEGRERRVAGDWGRRRPFLVEIQANGNRSRPLAVPVPEEAPPTVRPVVASGSLGRIFIAWTEHWPGGTEVALIRGRRGEP